MQSARLSNNRSDWPNFSSTSVVPSSGKIFFGGRNTGELTKVIASWRSPRLAVGRITDAKRGRESHVFAGLFGRPRFNLKTAPERMTKRGDWCMVWTDRIAWRGAADSRMENKNRQK